jgi:parallel beta-helix repeat protein
MNMEISFLLILFTKIWFLSPEASLTTDSHMYKSFDKVIENASDGDTIILKKGTYTARGKPYKENICGNCENPSTEVHATVGFHIKEKSLSIRGEERDSTVLITNSGYGILFEKSYGSLITNLTVTGGVRDPDGMATDAGIVGKNCKLTVRNVRIIDNIHRVDTVVVGIGGVFGREGSELFIIDNLIENNGWDGIALYRGATATIIDNTIKGGRGAGIGITWDASALILRNSITGYWKGIGSFGQSTVSVRNNSVYKNLGWGIVATGNSYMEVVNNVISENGNCGFAAWTETARGILKNNIIVKNGWREEWVCPGVGVWMNTSRENFPIEYNNVWNNEAGNYKGIHDLTGMEGNISEDPLFLDDSSFSLTHYSSCINSGDSLIIDRNGTRSDMGIHGGPHSTQR